MSVYPKVYSGRPEWLQALDVRMETFRLGALAALRRGETVNIVCDGRVIGRFHPDGSREVVEPDWSAT